MARVTVALLGDMEVRVDGRTVPITRPRLRALLGALALRADRVVPIDTLAAQVWGERMPDRFRAGLHTLVNQLRQPRRRRPDPHRTRRLPAGRAA